MPNKKYCSNSCSSKSHPEINLMNLEKRDKEKQRKVVSERKGEKHPKWIKDRTLSIEKHRMRGTDNWKNWRTLIFQRDNYTCQECGTNKIYLEPHHIIPLRESFEKAFDVNNLGL